MSKPFVILLTLLLLLSSSLQASAYAPQFVDDSRTVRLHWKTKLIPITFSTSLTAPNPSFRSESDVKGAIERSLATWERAADIKFQVVWSDKQDVSPSGKSGDGTSLVTVAQTAENLQLFGSDAQEVSARTRIFFSRKGFITEADIVLNPYEQFSTDGSIGTFDFEATLTHEIGHLLGLEHSSVTGATMHEHQGKNGIYNLPAYNSRTLAKDDTSGIRALYGANPADEENCCGTIGGKLTQANGKAAKDFQVWAEEAESGRMMAEVVTDSGGNYHIEGLPSGLYKVFTQNVSQDSEKSFSVEELGEVGIIKGKTQNLQRKLKNNVKHFDVSHFGFNGQISELAVPINGGKSYLIYIGGKNLDADKISIGFNSSYLSVNPKSLVNHDYGADISVVSFEINVDAEIPLGEYSFFIRNNGQEKLCAVGGLTVETLINPWYSHPMLTND
jgi:hypothetical protein